MNRPSVRSLVTPLIMGAIVAAILILILTRKPVKPVPPVPEAPTAVRVQAVRAGALPDIVELTGRLAPDEDAVLATRKPGLVRKVHVDKGVRVKAGDLLLELDSTLWTSAVRKADLSLAEAERDLARWKELATSGAVSPTDLDRLQTRRDLAAETVTEARAHLDQCFVRSPADGWIDQRFLSEGEFAPEGAAAYRFVKLNPLKVQFDLPERDGRALTAGLALPFTLDGFPTAKTGLVSFIARAASPENNAFRVELTVPNADEALQPGMIARIAVTRRQYEHALVTPLSAVIPHKDVHVVYVARDGKAVRRIVKLAGLLGEGAIIEDGLREGDEVIVEGNRSLSDGTPVRIMPDGDGALP
jgi:membrane fusion protein (multidrug efflux system)